MLWEKLQLTTLKYIGFQNSQQFHLTQYFALHFMAMSLTQIMNFCDSGVIQNSDRNKKGVLKDIGETAGEEIQAWIWLQI